MPLSAMVITTEFNAFSQTSRPYTSERVIGWCPFLGSGSAVIYLLFNLALIVCGFFVFGSFFVVQYFVSFLIFLLFLPLGKREQLAFL